MEVRDGRSEHALAVDRGIQAQRIVSGDDYQSWSKDKSSSDLEDWDVKYASEKRKEQEKSKPEPVSPTKKPGLNIEEARRVFRNLPLKQQIKDRMSTEPYVKTDNQYAAWKKNPRHFDIEGIDDQPKGFAEMRLKKVQDHFGLQVVDKSNIKKQSMSEQSVFKRKSREARGYWSPNINGIDTSRKVFITPKAVDSLFTASHETGHAVDNIFVKSVTGKDMLNQYNSHENRSMFNAKFLQGTNLGKNIKPAALHGHKYKELVNSFKIRPAFGGDMFFQTDVSLRMKKEGVVNIPTSVEKRLPFYKKALIESKGKHSQAYRHHEYRNNPQEIFADNFASFVLNPNSEKKFKSAKWDIAWSKEKQFKKQLHVDSVSWIKRHL